MQPKALVRLDIRLVDSRFDLHAVQCRETSEVGWNGHSDTAVLCRRVIRAISGRLRSPRARGCLWWELGLRSRDVFRVISELK